MENNSFTLSYDIYEGPKYYHRNVEWFGNDLVSDSTLTDAFDFKSGDIFNLDKFNFSLFQNVSSLYMDKGYLNMSLNHSFNYIDKDSIDITFNIIENNIVKVRKIIIPESDQFQLTIENFCSTIQKNSRRNVYEKEFLNQALIMNAARISNTKHSVIKIKN